MLPGPPMRPGQRPELATTRFALLLVAAVAALLCSLLDLLRSSLARLGRARARPVLARSSSSSAAARAPRASPAVRRQGMNVPAGGLQPQRPMPNAAVHGGRLCGDASRDQRHDSSTTAAVDSTTAVLTAAAAHVRASPYARLEYGEDRLVAARRPTYCGSDATPTSVVLSLSGNAMLLGATATPAASSPAAAPASSTTRRFALPPMRLELENERMPRPPSPSTSPLQPQPKSVPLGTPDTSIDIISRAMEETRFRDSLEAAQRRQRSVKCEMAIIRERQHGSAAHASRPSTPSTGPPLWAPREQLERENAALVANRLAQAERERRRAQEMVAQQAASAIQQSRWHKGAQQMAESLRSQLHALRSAEAEAAALPASTPQTGGDAGPAGTLLAECSASVAAATRDLGTATRMAGKRCIEAGEFAELERRVQHHVDQLGRIRGRIDAIQREQLQEAARSQAQRQQEQRQTPESEQPAQPTGVASGTTDAAEQRDTAGSESVPASATADPVTATASGDPAAESSASGDGTHIAAEYSDAVRKLARMEGEIERWRRDPSTRNTMDQIRKELSKIVNMLSGSGINLHTVKVKQVLSRARAASSANVDMLGYALLCLCEWVVVRCCAKPLPLRSSGPGRRPNGRQLTSVRRASAMAR